MTSSARTAPSTAASGVWARPIVVVLLRWVVFAVGVWLVRELAGAALLQPGDNIGSPEPSSPIGVAVTGLVLTGFALVAVAGRWNARIPVWLAATEVVIVGFVAVWPNTNARAWAAFDRFSVVNYQMLAAVWLAGAIVTLAGLLRRKDRTA